ncbi:MAG: hypothetical protein SPH68_06960 [Candidatus Borkfalkiaceae bacterium]|nr:hypothetical protein [Clostridia bacterium]MDY6223879.1 hypothetical protein [Christensenellaceae bacterium]
MSIKHTAVSYYGLGYTEQAERDFREMKEHGCDTVILAVTEFDLDFWFPNLNNIVKKAHEIGLRAIADPWGIGKYFGGEQVSLFLQNNIHNRQVSAFTDEVLNFACFNTSSFRDYFKNFCLKIAQNTEVDGFFWDEPHYAYPKSYASITGGAGDDWSCRCPVCKKKFLDYYGYEMPRMMNDDVKQFRWREAMVILTETSKALKEYNPKLEITCCVHATMNTYYVTELRGYDNWDLVASCPYFDVFSTTIISWDLPEKFFIDITERTVKTARKYNKQSERWIMGYNKSPKDLAQVDRVVSLYENMGVDRLATWTYRGGYGTVVQAENPLQLWDRIGENYNRVKKK